MYCGKQLSLASGTDVHIFTTRTGTKQGVESHTFRVESPRDQAIWCKSLVNGAHQAAHIVQEVTCGEFIATVIVQESACNRYAMSLCYTLYIVQYYVYSTIQCYNITIQCV